jgi:SRSO17 transposase
MSEDRQERFTAYVEALAEVIGHADRAEPLRDYCLGLLLPGERKSVEPIAAPPPAGCAPQPAHTGVPPHKPPLETPPAILLGPRKGQLLK